MGLGFSDVGGVQCGISGIWSAERIEVFGCRGYGFREPGFCTLREAPCGISGFSGEEFLNVPCGFGKLLRDAGMLCLVSASAILRSVRFCDVSLWIWGLRCCFVLVVVVLGGV